MAGDALPPAVLDALAEALANALNAQDGDDGTISSGRKIRDSRVILANQMVKHAPALIAAARRAAVAVSLLRTVEWSALDDDEAACPYCGCLKRDGHQETNEGLYCDLARALAPSGEQGE